MLEQPLAITAQAQTDAAAGAATHRLPWYRQRCYRSLQAYLYLLPALVSIGVWVYWPLVNTAVLSFYQWNLLPTVPMTYVGLENFRRVLSLPEIGIAVRNTGIYIVGLMFFSVLLPLTVAIVVADLQGRIRASYRALVFTPVLIAPVVVAIVWRWILNPLQGVLYVTLNTLLDFESIQWLNDRTLLTPQPMSITSSGNLPSAVSTSAGVRPRRCSSLSSLACWHGSFCGLRTGIRFMMRDACCVSWYGQCMMVG